jgi:hypothetical protein
MLPENRHFVFGPNFRLTVECTNQRVEDLPAFLGWEYPKAALGLVSATSGARA